MNLQINARQRPFRQLDHDRLHSLLSEEKQRFFEANPQSQALFERAKGSLLAGVPMNWMVKWAGTFPLFVESAKGAHFTDVDGHDYLDLCLGDTGAMTGHAPDSIVQAIYAQAQRGMTFMLPVEDTLWVAEELARGWARRKWSSRLPMVM